MGEEKSKSFNAIDTGKFILAFFAIAVHTHPMDHNRISRGIYLSHICIEDIISPFFFLASGFLLFRNLQYPYTDRKSLGKIKNFHIKMIKYYCFWSLVYLPLAISSYRRKGWDFLRSLRSYMQGFFFIGEHFNSWMLWYLLAVIYALALVLFLLRFLRLKPEIIALVGTIIFLISMGFTYLSVYDGDLPPFLQVIREGLSETIVNGRVLTGCFYLPAGILLARYDLPLFASALMVVSGFYLRFHADNTFANAVAAALNGIGFFSLAKQIKLPDSEIFPILRKMSTVIYFIHLLVWTVFYTVRYGTVTYGLESFLVTSLISLIIAAAYVSIRRVSGP